MKTITFLPFWGFIMFLANPIYAQSPIVVQNDNSSTFYSTLDLAITNAVAGDYIYLPGGSFTISVPIDKQLQIVGVGHNPDSCAVTGITQVVGNFQIKSGSDHGSITGLRISGGITFSVNETDPIVNYYSIERCNISGPTHAIILTSRSLNILINECIIHGFIVGYYIQGFQMSKCIVDASSNANSIYWFYSNSYFINNIFIGSANGIAGVSNCVFRNNVFLNQLTNHGSENINNQFQNNLFYGGFTNSSTVGLLLNNITGPVSTLFVNQSGTVFDYKQDYHILETSPAHNAGTDGTDLGIYGTGSPWKEGSLPSNPHIQSKSISTVNGNLNVKIKVAAQDN